MGIFDMFRKRKPIPAPWSKYYTDEELDIKIPNISLYKQVVNSSESYPDFLAYKYFQYCYLLSLLFLHLFLQI